jgi:hypothetical protein
MFFYRQFKLQIYLAYLLLSLLLVSGCAQQHQDEEPVEYSPTTV